MASLPAGAELRVLRVAVLREVLFDLRDDLLAGLAGIDRDPLRQVAEERQALRRVGRDRGHDHRLVQREPQHLGGNAAQQRDAIALGAYVPLRVQVGARAHEGAHHEQERDAGPGRDPQHGDRASTAPGFRLPGPGVAPLGHRRGRHVRRAEGRGRGRRGRSRLAGEVDDHRRHVVDAAVLVRLGHEGTHRLGGIGRVAEHREDPVVAHHAGQAVGAQQQAITVLEVDDALVHEHVGLGAERAGEHAALRVARGLLGGQLTAHLHLSDHRVVLGERAQVAVAQQVRARVADVGQAQPVAVGHRRGQRRPHPRDVGVAQRSLEHRAVRVDELLGERAALVLEQRFQGFEREVRGDLAALVPAHPVGDGHERDLDEVGVLVPGTHLADVGRRGDGRLHARSSITVVPIRIRSPARTCARPSRRRSFRNVPFVDPRSCTSHTSPSGDSRAWDCDA